MPCTATSRSAGELMRRQYIALSPSQSVLDALAMMRFARLRQLPVVEDGWLRGLIWYLDLIAAISPDEVAAGVNQRMREAVFVSPDQNLGSAARLMVERSIGSLPVARSEPDGAWMLGVLTERDLLRAAYS